jgi:hypothetical protein
MADDLSVCKHLAGWTPLLNPADQMKKTGFVAFKLRTFTKGKDQEKEHHCQCQCLSSHQSSLSISSHFDDAVHQALHSGALSKEGIK